MVSGRWRCCQLEPRWLELKLEIKLERVAGIEPALFAWEARVLPLNDTREAPNYKAAYFWISPKHRYLIST